MPNPASQTWERVLVAPRRATRAGRRAYHPCLHPWGPGTSAGAANSHRGATVGTPQKRFPHRLPAEAGRTREGVRRSAEVPGTHLMVALGASTALTHVLAAMPTRLTVCVPSHMEKVGFGAIYTAPGWLSGVKGGQHGPIYDPIGSTHNTYGAHSHCNAPTSTLLQPPKW